MSYDLVKSIYWFKSLFADFWDLQFRHSYCTQRYRLIYSFPVGMVFLSCF